MLTLINIFLIIVIAIVIWINNELEKQRALLTSLIPTMGFALGAILRVDYIQGIVSKSDFIMAMHKSGYIEPSTKAFNYTACNVKIDDLIAHEIFEEGNKELYESMRNYANNKQKSQEN